jgi:hypothetical protein
MRRGALMKMIASYESRYEVENAPPKKKIYIEGREINIRLTAPIFSQWNCLLFKMYSYELFTFSLWPLRRDTAARKTDSLAILSSKERQAEKKKKRHVLLRTEEVIALSHL